MNLMVFPSSRRRDVEPLVRKALAGEPGIADVTLTVVRLLAGWAVSAAGLNDPFRERDVSERVHHALRRAGI